MPSYPDPETERIFDAVRSGRLTRRQFARRLAGVGFASSAIATFLAACGPSAPAAPTSAPAAPAPTAAPTALPAVRPTVPVPAAATSAPAAAATPAGVLASVGPNPKRGGTLRIAFGV